MQHLEGTVPSGHTKGNPKRSTNAEVAARRAQLEQLMISAPTTRDVLMRFADRHGLSLEQVYMDRKHVLTAWAKAHDEQDLRAQRQGFALQLDRLLAQAYQDTRSTDTRKHSAGWKAVTSLMGMKSRMLGAQAPLEVKVSHDHTHSVDTSALVDRARAALGVLPPSVAEQLWEHPVALPDGTLVNK